MARELRSRKVVSETQNGDVKAKAVEKVATQTKRKAADDSSPVARKQQKSTKVTKAKKTEQPKLLPTKKAAKKATPAEEPEEGEDSESDAEGEDNAQALALQVDPEDEQPRTAEAEAAFMTGGDVGKIPKIARRSAAKSSNGEVGVIYVGRIPHGFYEHEMRQYFSQFGPINKLRISRNKKTGASKHFAFVEFAEDTTAEIVAKTMNNYLLFGHVLKVKTIPKDQVHPDLFKGANKRFKQIPWNKMAGKQLEKPLSQTQWTTKVTKEKSKRAKQAAQLKAMGYEFEATEIKDVPPPALALEDEAETKAIEDASAPEPVVEVTKEVIETPEEEAEVEVKTISAPKKKVTKTKAKVTKGRAKKARA